jgi:peptide deformylase
MIRNVLILGNPKLRTECEVVQDFQNIELKLEIEDIKETLEDFRQRNGFGRGIAAIQIGIQKRIIGLNLGDGPYVIINPKIISTNNEQMTIWDDCMSFPDLVVMVKRYTKISMEYKNENGEIQVWNDLTPSESELLQHEIDHLDGIMAIDKAIDAKSIIYKSEYEQNREFYQKMTNEN